MATWEFWDDVMRPTCRVRGEQRHALARSRVPGWQGQALCASADPEAWFPRLGQRPQCQVLSTCQNCPVRRPCLATALLFNLDGIWAGTTVEARDALYAVLGKGFPADELLDLVSAWPAGHVQRHGLDPIQVDRSLRRAQSGEAA